MTAEPLYPARASTPSRGQCLSSAMRAARLWPALVVACVFAAACSDDDRATLSQTGDPSHSHAQQPAAEPLAQSVTAPPATIAIVASPTLPMKRTDAATSPAAAPLAAPVIHTVD